MILTFGEKEGHPEIDVDVGIGKLQVEGAKSRDGGKVQGNNHCHATCSTDSATTKLHVFHHLPQAITAATAFSESTVPT